MRFIRVVGEERSRIVSRPSRAAVPRPAEEEIPEPGPRGPAARPDRPHVRPASYFLVSLLFSILIFGVFLISDRGFLQVRRQRKQLVKVQAEVTALDAENRKLEAEVSALKSDPKAVEKIAREKLNLVRPGEIVVVLPDGWQSRVRPKPTAPP